jgi:hypothetical protein
LVLLNPLAFHFEPASVIHDNKEHILLLPLMKYALRFRARIRYEKLLQLATGIKQSIAATSANLALLFLFLIIDIKSGNAFQTVKLIRYCWSKLKILYVVIKDVLTLM